MCKFFQAGCPLEATVLLKNKVASLGFSVNSSLALQHFEELQ